MQLSQLFGRKPKTAGSLQEKATEAKHENPVLEAIQLAVQLKPTELDLVTGKIKKLSDKIEHHEALSAKLTLGIEAGAKAKVDAACKKLKADKKLETKFRWLGKRYRLMSNEPLTWRDKKGLPLLAVYDTNRPHFVIGKEKYEIGFSTDGRYVPGAETPEELQDIYMDVARRHPEYLVSTFDSTIPDDVKQKMVECKEDFERLVVIGEASWRKVVHPDPILAGWAAGKLWFIANWDMTPIEQAMMNAMPETRN